MRGRERYAPGECGNHNRKTDNNRVFPADFGGQQACQRERHHCGGLRENEGNNGLVLFEPEYEFRIFYEVGRQRVVRHIEAEHDGKYAEAVEVPARAQRSSAGSARAVFQLPLFPARKIFVTERGVEVRQVKQAVLGEGLHVQRVIFAEHDFLLHLFGGGVHYFAVETFALRYDFLFFFRLFAFGEHVGFELRFVDGCAEPYQHHERGDDERRSYRVVSVEHHEDVEIQHGDDGQNDRHDIAHRVRHTAETVGVDVGHERQRGRAVRRHRRKRNQETDYEGHEILLPERRENTDARKTYHRNHGADDDIRFAAAERSFRFVREFAEEGQKEQSQYVVGGDDNAVPHGVEPEHVVVDGLHDSVIRPPKEGNPSESQRAKQCSFPVELHKKIISSKRAFRNRPRAVVCGRASAKRRKNFQNAAFICNLRAINVVFAQKMAYQKIFDLRADTYCPQDGKVIS